MKALFWLWISGMTACWQVIALRSEATPERAAAGGRLIDYLGGR